MALLCSLLQLAVFAVLAWIVLGYVVVFGRLPWGHPVRRLYDLLGRGIEPILRPIRQVLPPIRVGAGALDLSPLVLIIGVQLLVGIIC